MRITYSPSALNHPQYLNHAQHMPAQQGAALMYVNWFGGLASAQHTINSTHSHHLHILLSSFPNADWWVLHSQPIDEDAPKLIPSSLFYME